jgi:hypothetical protein
VPITKPAEKHKYNTKTIQIHNNRTLNNQMKIKTTNKTTLRKQHYKLSTESKALNPENQKNKINTVTTYSLLRPHTYKITKEITAL